MQPAAETAPVSKVALWSGRILSVLLGLLRVIDGVMKLIKPQDVVKATVELGYPESTILPIGVAALVSALLYLIPRTSMLGAILLTGTLVPLRS
jgi:DoxX-like family